MARHFCSCTTPSQPRFMTHYTYMLCNHNCAMFFSVTLIRNRNIWEIESISLSLSVFVYRYHGNDSYLYPHTKFLPMLASRISQHKCSPYCRNVTLQRLACSLDFLHEQRGFHKRCLDYGLPYSFPPTPTPPQGADIIIGSPQTYDGSAVHTPPINIARRGGSLGNLGLHCGLHSWKIIF